MNIEWNKFYPPNVPLLDTKLPQEVVDRLWEYINEAQGDASARLAGNITDAKDLIDRDDWFLDSVIRPIYDNYYNEVGLNTTNATKRDICLNGFWVNYQNKHEFSPVHSHSGTISFVIWMKIPYHWREEQKESKSNCPCAGDFSFVYTDILGRIQDYLIKLNDEDEGLMVLFPASLKHLVYPFHTSDSERLSIAGNILWK